MRVRISFLALLLLGGSVALLGQTIQFAVIGDSGTGDQHQREVAAQMVSFHHKHPWEFVLMLGDNIYEDGNPKDFDRKFKNVYKNLPVEFHATLGNHDRRNRNGMAQVEDGAFGYVEHKDEYTFPAGPEIAGKTLARFICLNSGAWKDGEALQEREKQLDGWLAESSKFHWNFVFFHHPIYSFAHSTWPFGWLIGRRGHGSDKKLQLHWEQRFANGGIDIVLSGHDHFYQKITPQSGIHYFVSGGAGKVRNGVKDEHEKVEFGKEVLHFLHFEVSENEVRYFAVDIDGDVFHQGTIPSRE